MPRNSNLFSVVLKEYLKAVGGLYVHCKVVRQQSNAIWILEEWPGVSLCQRTNCQLWQFANLCTEKFRVTKTEFCSTKVGVLTVSSVLKWKYREVWDYLYQVPYCPKTMLLPNQMPGRDQITYWGILWKCKSDIGIPCPFSWYTEQCFHRLAEPLAEHFVYNLYLNSLLLMGWSW